MPQTYVPMSGAAEVNIGIWGVHGARWPGRGNIEGIDLVGDDGRGGGWRRGKKRTAVWSGWGWEIGLGLCEGGIYSHWPYWAAQVWPDLGFRKIWAHKVLCSCIYIFISFWYSVVVGNTLFNYELALLEKSATLKSQSRQVEYSRLMYHVNSR